MKQTIHEQSRFGALAVSSSVQTGTPPVGRLACVDHLGQQRGENHRMKTTLFG